LSAEFAAACYSAAPPLCLMRAYAGIRRHVQTMLWVRACHSAMVEREDLAASLEPTDRDYLAACRTAELAAKGRARRIKAMVGVLILTIVAGLVAFLLRKELSQFAVDSYNEVSLVVFWASIPKTTYNNKALSDLEVRNLKPGNTFAECEKIWSEDQPKRDIYIYKFCPEMVMVPTGEFTMGARE
jgi:hypothetical protein